MRSLAVFVLITAAAGLVYADEPSQPKVISLSKSSEVIAVAYSPDGKYLAVAESAFISILDPSTGDKIRTLEGHRHAISSVAFDPSSKLLVSGDSDGTLILWKLENGERRFTLQQDEWPINSVAYRPDGKTIVTAGNDKKVRIWDAESGKETSELSGHRDAVLGLSYSPDGALLASCGGDGTVRLWDSKSGQSIRELSMLGSVWGVTIGKGGKVAAASASRKSPIAQVWDATSGKQLLTLAGHQNSLLAISFSPDGRLLATASSDTTVRLWDAVTGEKFAVFEGHTKPVQAIAFSPDGKKLASRGRENTVRIWSIPKVTGKK